ncbi:cytochrome b [Herbaspirillum sp. RTI4]|uniref:cytochrome b n=1 Tax=Herbaspirillum sp. RTI4 TaxID=3048640 RepID=UPI002AB4586D|nr:cytochrome b [Herbaspirillum sp. RTI4]MDY7576784.1 cytochrome b [Herbaspirillum sp. RTI4]MEA9981380.1 cytochrome b [Herbaspirillum sp. RTI4]
MQRYSFIAIFFHWLVALLIIVAFTLGLTMVDMSFSPAKLRYVSWHKWLGVTIFALACLRLLWRLSQPSPTYPTHMPHWQQQAARWMHVLLYALIFAIPLSGYFYSLASGVPIVYLSIFPLPVLMAPDAGLKPILKLAHYVLNMILLGGVGLHVLAALKHQFIDRDGILRKMLP